MGDDDVLPGTGLGVEDGLALFLVSRKRLFCNDVAPELHAQIDEPIVLPCHHHPKGARLESSFEQLREPQIDVLLPQPTHPNGAGILASVPRIQDDGMEISCRHRRPPVTTVPRAGLDSSALRSAVTVPVHIDHDSVG